MTRIAVSLAILLALGSPARADGDVGVIVAGEGSMQPQLAAQIESWLSKHGHTLVPSPLPPDAVTALIDCMALDIQGCAREIVEKQARSSSMVYAKVELTSDSDSFTRNVTLTAYWFDKGHDAVSQKTLCARCTDQTLRTTADAIMRKLVGGGELGHVKLKSNPPGARITIDGKPIGVTPLDWDLASGTHTIKMDKSGTKPESRTIIVVSSRTDTLQMDLVPGGEEDQASRSRILPFAALGVGAALIGTGIVLIAIDQDPGPHAPPRIYDTAGQGVGLAIGGALVAGVGAYLLWFRSPRAASTPVAAFTSDTAYIGWLGRF
ncbi:MAG TPA: PEGA domain-containing protein [Kofleriaceae bacterium]|nr:PEGA domain-containing protein [Kofleriaceae bacterium]